MAARERSSAAQRRATNQIAIAQELAGRSTANKTKRWKGSIFHLSQGIAIRKAILMLLLAVVSKNTMAEWERIGNANDGNSTEYADPSTILRDGHLVRMWGLSDYKSAETVATYLFLSVRLQNEYDCNDRQIRPLSYSFHSGNMGKGVVVYAYSEPFDSIPISPDSLSETLWKIACGKR